MKFEQINWLYYISHKDCFCSTHCLCTRLRLTLYEHAACVSSYDEQHAKLRWTAMCHIQSYDAPCESNTSHLLRSLPCKLITVLCRTTPETEEQFQSVWFTVNVHQTRKCWHAFPTWFARCPFVFIVIITVSEWGKCEIDRPKLQQTHQVRNMCIYRVAAQILVWLNIHWSLFPKAQLTIIQYKFR